jgi:prepilin-type N-terminal cleavage/methylation domain-containing protein
MKCIESNGKFGSTPGRAQDSAFTLIELMVVIALISITAAMIIPEMKGSYEATLLRSASRELIDAFSTANSQAISLNQAHRVRIDEKTGHYVVEKAMTQRIGDTVFSPVKDLAGGEGQVSDHITVQVRALRQPGASGDESELLSMQAGEAGAPSAQNSLTFHPDGTTDNKEILLKDRQGFGLVLRLNPVTARVRITELAHQ